ncbi:hypothetical protein BCAH1134_C0082 (plasmid) [Bacillus cereus AH1134]|nr:hypothetical protein BCAH1134_C0082 [Bacillus cereus AH1134]
MHTNLTHKIHTMNKKIVWITIFFRGMCYSNFKIMLSLYPCNNFQSL